MTILKAINLVNDYYFKALAINKEKENTIKNPVAWALYQVWREVDK